MLIAKKRISTTFVSLGFLVAGTQAVAQFDSGSDGTDGVFDRFGGVIEIDLSLAVDGTWNDPGSGNGVYDANLWAVVFKYTTAHGRSELQVKANWDPQNGCP